MSLDYKTILELDANKLHAESLQLRNQQFQIVTIALASTGISAWIVPAITSLEKPLEDWVIVAATVGWIILLGVLFYWSLALKRLIDIIAVYIKKKKTSEWEPKFHQFDKESKFHLGQTRYSLIVFLCYGLIVTVSGFIATNGIVCQSIVIVTGVIYCLVCYLRYRNRSKSKKIGMEWDRILKDEN